MSEKKKLPENLRRVGKVLLIAAVLLTLSLPGRRFWRELMCLSGFEIRTDAPLSIHVLDVGKADAILLICEGETALLDAGTGVSGSEIKDYLGRCKIGRLDYVIASHPDSDHIGGMPRVLREVECGEFVRSAYFEEEYSLVEQARSENSVPLRVVSVGDVIRLGGAELEVLGPVREYEDTNNASLVLRLTYGDFTALFCGDIEREAEQDLVGSGADLSVDLLKVAHHGSDTSSTPVFLNIVRPNWAVISVGRDNNELPKEIVLRRLDKVCAEVFRTDTDGNIIFTYDKTEGFQVSIKN